MSSSALCKAAREIEKGFFEADLGGGICKKRIPLPGHGKSGSIRTIVAKKNKDAIIFIVGREKNASGSDFTNTEQEAATMIGRALEKVSINKLRELVAVGTLRELHCYD